MKILSIGEVLWDVFPHGEKLGGAPFNFAYHARRLGHEVLFLSAVGDDRRGEKVLEQAHAMGLETKFIRRVPAPPGVVTVKLDAEGTPAFTIHRPAAYDLLRLNEDDLDEISRWKPDWIAYGTLHSMEPAIHALLQRLIRTNPGARGLYDINLRKDSYTPELVAQLLPLADAVKLNDDEASALAGMFGARPGSLEEFCRGWAARYNWQAMCVTMGERGCAVLAGGVYAEAPGYRVEVADTVGAGDAFAAAFLHGLHKGWPAARIGDFANRLGALVTSRPGGTPHWTLGELGIQS